MVLRADPFHSTTELVLKPEPFTVSVTPAPPTVAAAGLRAASTGTGFTASMVKLCAFDVPPPGVGLNTSTDAVPALAISVAGIDAAIWVGDI